MGARSRERLSPCDVARGNQGPDEQSLRGLAGAAGPQAFGRQGAAGAWWLIAEQPEGEPRPTKYVFSNRPPRTSLKRLVAIAKSRWWIEHSYRELKDVLGLGHFEGRSWRGWQHHVALVLLAYALLQHVRRRSSTKGAA
ncbi:MAG: hypothetical protein CMJ58_15305 [Planctomycetaceae bacterium]|nr:hypothetical protein [Planctomycetaceae bacterium]